MLFTRDAVGLACDMFACYYGFVKKIKEIKKKYMKKTIVIHSIFKKKIIKLNF
jgi:hypothetical protein